MCCQLSASVLQQLVQYVSDVVHFVQRNTSGLFVHIHYIIFYLSLTCNDNQNEERNFDMPEATYNYVRNLS